MKSRAAVLFLTHKWDRVTRLKFERLQSEIGALGDVFLYMQTSEAADRAAAEAGVIARSLVRFDAGALPGQLGYPYAFENRLVPGSAHFPILAFSQAFRYDHYFVIEYDVDFSGRWSEFIAGTLATVPDLAAFHVRSPAECPNWVWWRAYRPGRRDRDWGLDRQNLRRSFNPVYCLSHRAAQIVHAAQRDGWRGHYELLFATILSHHGCNIVDLREMSDFCVGVEQELRQGMPLDDLSTVRWRPSVSQSEFLVRSNGHTLFHPIKDPWYFDGARLVSVEPDTAARPPMAGPGGHRI